MNTICAFSSDSRELYKADIYRVLSLPEGHIVHFRYKTRYVDDTLLSPNVSLIDERVAVFFTHGNTIDSNSFSFKHISVRWAIITKTETSHETGVFHIYMKLGEFSNISIDSGSSQEKQPPTKFFTKLTCTSHSEENNWQARIRSIKTYFPTMTFFHLKKYTRCQR